MQRRVIQESDGSVFTGYKEFDYYKRLNANQKKMLSPKDLEQSPYKLHVSVAENAYLKHRNALITIILFHLKKGTINDFKYTDYQALKTKVTSAECIQALIYDYYNNCSAIDEEWKTNFLNTINHHFHSKLFDFPKKPLIKQIFSQVSETIRDGKRLMTGDQFTIYIPQEFKKNDILSLCEEINRYLKKSKIAYGTFAEVESLITAHISLRQEYLEKDFQAINNGNLKRLKNRVDAVADPEKPSTKRRQKILAEQQKSDLYQYLCHHLNSQRLSGFSLFSCIQSTLSYPKPKILSS